MIKFITDKGKNNKQKGEILLDKVLNRTISYLFALLYIIVFEFLFGKENLLIGIVGLIGTYTCYHEKVKGSIVLRSLLLSFLYLSIGIAAYISRLNVVISIPISFFVIFFISYSVYSRVYSNNNYSYILLYLISLSNPISYELFLKRILALIFIGTSTVILKTLYRKYMLINKEYKIIQVIFNEIYLLLKFVQTKKEGKYIKKKEKVYRLFVDLETLLYDRYLKKEKNSNDLKIKINIVSFLYDLVNNIKYDMDLKELKAINTKLDEYFNIFNLILIKENKGSINTYDNSLLVYKLEMREKNKLDKLKISYCLRISFGITQAIFIWQLFKLIGGFWIAYSVFLVLNPEYEICKKKIIRMIYVALGSMIYLYFLFPYIKKSIIADIIFLFIVYLVFYIKDKEIIFSIIMIIGLLPNTIINDISINLMSSIFIVIGCIMATLLNNYFFPYDRSMINKELFSIYELIIKVMREEVYGKEEDVVNSAYYYFVMCCIIEQKIIIGNNKIHNREIEELINRKHKEVEDILMLAIKKSGKEKEMLNLSDAINSL